MGRHPPHEIVCRGGWRWTCRRFGCPNFFKGGRSAHVRQTVRFAVLFVVHVIDPHLKIHPRHRSAPYTSLSLIPSLSHSPLSLLRLSPLSLPTFLPHAFSSYLLPTALGPVAHVASGGSGRWRRWPASYGSVGIFESHERIRKRTDTVVVFTSEYSKTYLIQENVSTLSTVQAHPRTQHR